MQRQRKTYDYLLRLVVGPLVPLPESLGWLPLPLAWEIVAAGVSLGGNKAHEDPVGVVGGCRKIENASCRKHGDLVNGGVRRWYTV